MIDGYLLAIAGSALFGLVDIGTTRVVRRVGVGATLAGLFGGCILLFLPITLATDSMPELDPPTLLRFALYGSTSAFAYLTLVAALRVGPLSVVGPVTSSVGAATALLAIVVLGERPSFLQLSWIAVAAIGSVLVAVLPGSSSHSVTLAGRGALFAALNVIGVAVVLLSLRDVTSVDWAGPILLLRSVAAIWLIVAGIARLRQPGHSLPWQAARSWVALAFILGVLDGVGLAAVALSFRVAPAWLVGIAAGVAPVMVTIGGIVLYRERVGRVQLLGIVLLAASFVQLAVPMTVAAD